MMRKVISYIATSADGYIAQPNDDLSFLSIVEQEGQDYGYSEFIQSVDTVLMGRKTYDKVLTMGFGYPHADKVSYILTKTKRQDEATIHFYQGNLKELVAGLKSKPGKNIFCDGGADVINQLLQDDLIDEIVLSIIPVFVGGGTKLFHDGRTELKLELVSVKQFEKGLVQLHYRRNEN